MVAGAGAGVEGAGQRAGGAGEVVRDRRTGQPGGVGRERPGGQVRQRRSPEVGDDLLDDRVVAVVGLGLQHRLGAVGEHRVVAPDGEQLRPARPGGSGLRRLTRRTINRAVTCWRGGGVNAV